MIGEAHMVRWTPVAGGDDEGAGPRRLVDQGVDARQNGVASWDGERAAGTETFLNVNDQESVGVADIVVVTYRPPPLTRRLILRDVRQNSIRPNGNTDLLSCADNIQFGAVEGARSAKAILRRITDGAVTRVAAREVQYLARVALGRAAARSRRSFENVGPNHANTAGNRLSSL